MKPRDVVFTKAQYILNRDGSLSEHGVRVATRIITGHLNTQKQMTKGNCT